MKAAIVLVNVRPERVDPTQYQGTPEICIGISGKGRRKQKHFTIFTMGELLHGSLRYFDPVKVRPGIPKDVAVLVDQVNNEGISLELVNLSPIEEKEVILQAGTFGEHEFGMVGQVYLINNYELRRDTYFDHSKNYN